MTNERFASIYPVAISFTRFFIKGALAGQHIPDMMRFVNRDSAARWLRGIRANSRTGKLEYKITLA